MKSSTRRFFLFAISGLTSMHIHANSQGDTTDVLQLLLDAPQLVQYYHFDTRPQRKPLRIRNNTAAAIDPKGLIVCEQAVKLTQAQDRDALEISKFEIDDAQAQVSFSFRAEGIRGSADFSKQQGVWRLVRINIAER